MINTQRPGLYILNDDEKGRGVYSVEDIPKGEIIELCPVIILEKEDMNLIHKTALHDYYFIWQMDKGSAALALGYGSLYNHADEANAEFSNDYETQMIKISAINDIPAHTEICIHYLSKQKLKGIKLWFEVK